MTNGVGSALAGAPERRGEFRAAVSAAAVTIPHAVGLGLIAFAPLGTSMPVPALALWSAALPGAIAALFAGRPGIVYAPTTVVALLYAAIVSALTATAGELGLDGAQILAACAATVALAFTFQWLFGVFRLASLARFLPISVMHGFAAGVGLSMVIGQVRSGFGLGRWDWSGSLLLHGVAAVSVLAVGRYCARRWPSWPGLLPAVIGVSAIAWWFGMGHMFTASAPAAPFALPPLPDPAGVPWMRLLQQHGVQLVSLALLMAVVNSLDVVVYYQELELEHGVHMDANASLRRESLIGIACGAVGLIPASTSASRTRIVIAEAGPSSDAGTLHAVILLLVAVTGHVWLHFVPMAALAGALIFAGYTQVPAVLWSRDYKRAAPDSWVQSWLVAVVFSAVGGAGALLAGLVLATLLLLRSSASNALRRALLDGQARSRRLRRAANEAWIAPRMNSVAVIELQGVMSFGVAAHMAEHVRALLLLRHDKVLIAANRVPAWDATALVQLQALPRDLATQGRKLAVCGLDARASAQLRNVLQFTDLDRGLEWAEDQILSERPLSTEGRPKADVLGELGEHLDTEAHDSLLGAFQPQPVAAGACIFNAGDQLRDLYIVEEGQVTMSTLWPPDAGLRLATIGQGMTFGEMAFLNGEARTACAGAGHEDVHLLRLSRDAFERWAEAHPQAALTFMSNLALIGTRRLASTTRQLRAVLE